MKKEQPNYYANIPADVRYCEDLTANSKLLYGEITALSNRDGFCWASNKYFAELYKVTPTSISLWIKKLRDNGFIDYEIEDSYKRKIYLKGVLRKVNRGIKKNERGVLKKVKHNNTVNNTINTTENSQPVFTKEIAIEKYKDKYKFTNISYQFDKFEIYNRDVRKKKLKSVEMGFLNWLKKAEEFKAKSPEAISQRERHAEKIKHDDKLLDMENKRASGAEASARIAEGKAILLEKLSVKN